MSLQAMCHVLDSPIPHRLRLVALLIADSCDEFNGWHVELTALSKHANLPRRQVAAMVKQLILDGWLRRVDSPIGEPAYYIFSEHKNSTEGGQS
jgi:hypothetical protein